MVLVKSDLVVSLPVASCRSVESLHAVIRAYMSLIKYEFVSGLLYTKAVVDKKY